MLATPRPPSAAAFRRRLAPSPRHRPLTHRGRVANGASPAPALWTDEVAYVRHLAKRELLQRDMQQRETAAVPSVPRAPGRPPSTRRSLHPGPAGQGPLRGAGHTWRKCRGKCSHSSAVRGRSPLAP